MAIITECFIQCDSCKINFGIDNRQYSAKQQEEFAIKNGWVIVSTADNRTKTKHYCQFCATIK